MHHNERWLEHAARRAVRMALAARSRARGIDDLSGPPQRTVAASEAEGLAAVLHRSADRRDQRGLSARRVDPESMLAMAARFSRLLLPLLGVEPAGRGFRHRGQRCARGLDARHQIFRTKREGAFTDAAESALPDGALS